MKIKVKEITKGCFPVRSNGEASDCYDLFLAEDIVLKKGDVYVAKLGVAMEMPKGIIARIYSRSSSPSKLGVTAANGLGFIDNIYKGDNDEWRCPMLALRDVTLTKGTRVCQFEIAPSQFATVWQKLKWLISKPLLVQVDYLGNSDRGGIGTSGK